MATQKILKLVIITFISTSMATNIQALLIEPTITTTRVSQTSLQQTERYSAIPWDFGAFDDGMNGDWNLFELCFYGETRSVLRSAQTDIALNDELSYIAFTESPLRENRFEYAQITTDVWLGIEPVIFYDLEAICEYGITPLSVQSSLDDAESSGTELAELYEREFISRPLCDVNNRFYDLSTFFEESERIIVIYRSEPNISSAAVPEPSTLVLLSFGTLVFIRKRG